jgi:hypothetical protein
MTLTQARAIQQYLKDQGIVATVHKEYSGRGMYGRTVPAISCALVGHLWRAIGALGYDLDLSQDNMGIGHILY